METFASKCMSRLEDAVRSAGYELTVTTGAGDEDTDLLVHVKGTDLEIWIYEEDGAEVSRKKRERRPFGRHFEFQGFDSPDELIAEFVSTVLSYLEEEEKQEKGSFGDKPKRRKEQQE